MTKEKVQIQKEEREGEGNANIANEQDSSQRDDDGSTAFINHNCTAIIKDGTGDTIILDMGASSHMTPHRMMLENYHSFPMPHII